MVDVFPCCCDGSPCDRFIDDLGFGACYVKDLDGKLRAVCPRFTLRRGVSFSEVLVPRGLVPK